jgi:hypothetical protein
MLIGTLLWEKPVLTSNDKNVEEGKEKTELNKD